MCKKVMRLSRVPTLKALNTTEFHFRCDDCEYHVGTVDRNF
jgi:hypothetical protein